MKLAAQYTKASIIIAISVLIIGSIIYFFTINYIARTQLDNDLGEEIEEVTAYLNTNHHLPKQLDFDTDITVFIKTEKSELPVRYFDTTYVNPKVEENEPGRAVSGLVTLGNQHYKVIIIESREATEYLIQFISLITIGLMVVLVFILFLTNRFILNGLWKPFYKTLIEIKSFNISDDKGLELINTNVDEFNELNAAVLTMSSNVISDFQNLKQYTDNASHEMQTPLAVITSKLDMLIQDETLKPEQYSQINDIYAATSKLARLNHSLLLLVKIENNLIDDIDTFNLSVLIEDKIKQFYELTANKQIQVEVNLSPKEIIASKLLIDILLNNLFSNAIRHNIVCGKLIINLTADNLTIRNSGSMQIMDADTIFERFQKSHKSEGTGLGLAIIKNICTKYKWQVSYFMEDQLHIFQIKF
jgi:signal transduction histidine kinase